MQTFWRMFEKTRENKAIFVALGGCQAFSQNFFDVKCKCKKEWQLQPNFSDCQNYFNIPEFENYTMNYEKEEKVYAIFWIQFWSFEGTYFGIDFWAMMIILESSFWPRFDRFWVRIYFQVWVHFLLLLVQFWSLILAWLVDTGFDLIFGPVKTNFFPEYLGPIFELNQILGSFCPSRSRFESNLWSTFTSNCPKWGVSQ